MLLRRRAQEIVELTEKTEREFLTGKEEIGGTISIGSGEGAVMRFLAGVMREFSELYPDVRFDLYSNNADHVKERLERGTLDIGVIIGNSDLSKYETIPYPSKSAGAPSSPPNVRFQKRNISPAKTLPGTGCSSPNRARGRALQIGSANITTRWKFTPPITSYTMPPCS